MLFTSRRSFSRPQTTDTTRTITKKLTRCSAVRRPCAACLTKLTRAACASSSTAYSTTPAAGSSRFTTSWKTDQTRPISTGSPSRAFRSTLTNRRSRRITSHGGAYLRFPNSTLPSPKCASFCWASLDSGSRSASTAGASTSRTRSTTTHSGANFACAYGRSIPRHTSSARCGPTPTAGSKAICGMR